MAVSDEKLLAVELVPVMRQQLERTVINVEESPHSDMAFYGAMAYMEALIDMRVFPIEEVTAARERIRMAVKTNGLEAS